VQHIATFFTHFGAMSFQRKLSKLGVTGTMKPVPRNVSSSCGTCVVFDHPFDVATMAVEDMEKVFVAEGDGYREIYCSDEE